MIVLSSCSNDDSPDSLQEDFFNLETGNVWVYKRYYSNDDLNYSFMNQIDSVKVEGDTLINNLTYKKVVRKKYTGGDYAYSITENLRVNDNGHMVNEQGVVIHPGTDNQFQYSKVVELTNEFGGDLVVFGNIHFQLLPNLLQVNVEGEDYLVHSYYGNFVSDNLEQTPNNYVFYQYKSGLGFVCEHEAALSGYGFFENRLVYYDVN